MSFDEPFSSDAIDKVLRLVKVGHIIINVSKGDFYLRSGQKVGNYKPDPSVARFRVRGNEHVSFPYAIQITPDGFSVKQASSCQDFFDLGQTCIKKKVA